MPNLPGTSRAQTIFLRAFRTDPFGPEPDKWPAPAVLRRWLRKPTFFDAMQSLRETLRYQSDFQLLAVAASASQSLRSSVAGCDSDESHRQYRAISDLLKLAHLRQRFTQPEPPKPSMVTSRDPLREVIDKAVGLLMDAPPGTKVETLFKYARQSTGRDLHAEFHSIRAERRKEREEREANAPRRKLLKVAGIKHLADDATDD